MCCIIYQTTICRVQGHHSVYIRLYDSDEWWCGGIHYSGICGRTPHCRSVAYLAELQHATVVSLIRSAIEVWLWTFGSRTAWLLNKSAGISPIYSVRKIIVALCTAMAKTIELTELVVRVKS
jgi:hypothetical protein